MASSWREGREVFPIIINNWSAMGRSLNDFSIILISRFRKYGLRFQEQPRLDDIRNYPRARSILYYAGQYRVVTPKQLPSHATAPFNQTSPRRIWKENKLPGPGAYTLEEARGKERSIIKNCGNTFGLFETPIESAIFKSHSKRFQNNQQELPGPGQ